MKKLLVLLAILGYSALTNVSVLRAQTLSTSTTPEKTMPALDEKTQKKVDKATKDLAKDQMQLLKDTESLQKAQAKFDKDQAHGKLSPNDISKTKSKLMKEGEKLGKLKQDIAKNEEFLNK